MLLFTWIKRVYINLPVDILQNVICCADFNLKVLFNPAEVLKVPIDSKVFVQGYLDVGVEQDLYRF